MRYLLIFFAFVCINITTFAQSKEIIKEAKTKVNQLNEELIGVATEAALTRTQKREIKNLHIDKIAKIQAIRKNHKLSIAEKEASIKTIRKETGRVIFVEVLDYKQKQAKKKAGEKIAVKN